MTSTPTSPVDISKLTPKARRTLDPQSLQALYTEDELLFLFDEQEKRAKKRKLLRKWSPEEDEFLRSTYMYLSDRTIALALNKPISIVRARRKTLKLYKHQTVELEVIIWHNRENFEEDMKQMRLTKARPGAF